MMSSDRVERLLAGIPKSARPPGPRPPSRARTHQAIGGEPLLKGVHRSRHPHGRPTENVLIRRHVRVLGTHSVGGRSTSRRWPVAAVVSGDAPPRTLLGGDAAPGAGSPRRVPSPSGGWPRTLAA